VATSSLSEFKSTPNKKKWQTQDERKLLLFVQLFQQWLQVAVVTLHLEGLEEQKRREKEDRRRRAARRRTRRQRTQWVRQWLLRRPMHGQYEKLMHELTTEDHQASRDNYELPDVSALCIICLKFVYFSIWISIILFYFKVSLEITSNLHCSY